MTPDGAHLATASDDQTVRIWHPATGKTTTVSFVDRLSSRPLAGGGAAVSSGKLAIVWAEESAATVTVRAAIVSEP